MTIRFEDKDPADIIVVAFDFSATAAAVTSPAVSIAVASGIDASAAAMLLNAPTITGAKVLQRVQAGLSGVDYALQCVAYDGENRYTIDAILPVRDRPFILASSPVYLSEADFERRFGRQELSDLLAEGNSFLQAENDAASLIDGFLASRYSLPLTSIPSMVKSWAADITRWKLWDERAPQEVQRRYEMAMEQLKLLAAGKMALPPLANGQKPEVGVSFGGYSAERVFSSETLSDF